MKYLHPSPLRLLPYLLFQASTTFLKSSSLQLTRGIVPRKDSFNRSTNFHRLHRNKRTYCCFCSCKPIKTSGTRLRKVSMTANTEDAIVNKTASDSIISTSLDRLPSLPCRDAFLELCPKCHGEGRISKAPSKKARLRQQRQMYRKEQEQQLELDNIQHDNHKRIKRSSPKVPSPTADPIGTGDRDKGNNLVERKESTLPKVPRRWDPCPTCHQTGLLLPLTARSIRISSPATTSTDRQPFVAIIGGGIGGIALAVALRHRSIPFMVYEKDSRFDQRRQGYGLTLQQARRALEALGIFQNNSDGDNIVSKGGRLLQEHAVTSTKHVVHTPDGKQVGEWGLRRWVGSTDAARKNGENFSQNGGKFANTKTRDIDTKSPEKTHRPTRAKNKKRRQNLHVPRQTLRYALLESLKEASFINNEEAATADRIENNKATHMKRPSNNDHANLDISWGHKLVGMQPATKVCGKNRVQLSFEVVDEHGNRKGMITSEASLVVGCDGIRSTVRQRLLRANIGSNSNDVLNGTMACKSRYVSATPLKYLKCVVILGICPLADLFPQEVGSEREDVIQQQIKLSPLLDGETVFQTADGKTRIYMMPYSKKNNEYMWQLSFPVPEEKLAIALSQAGSNALKQEALRRCQSWHIPIPEILKATPIELISGYPVYDRDILTVDALSASRRDLPTLKAEVGDGNQQCISMKNDSTPTHSSNESDSFPITLLGDAAHPMSPFKGQGANQAILDALSLARSLYRIHCREGRSLEEALEYFENEMMARSSSKVKASSEAARFLHTDIAIQEGDVTRGAAAAVVKSSEGSV